MIYGDKKLELGLIKVSGGVLSFNGVIHIVSKI